MTRDLYIIYNKLFLKPNKDYGLSYKLQRFDKRLAKNFFDN